MEDRLYCTYVIKTVRRKVVALLVLQMENCSDGFNVPREHTAKLYIVGMC
jgi:hypothetical protein